MELSEIKEAGPKGATHFYPGCDDFYPHYIKSTPGNPMGESEVWLTGFVGGSSWNPLPSHPPLEECIDLRDTQYKVGDEFLFKKSNWTSWHECKVTYTGETLMVVMKKHPTRPLRWEEFVIRTTGSYGRDNQFKEKGQ